MPWGAEVDAIADFEFDMADPESPGALITAVNAKLGPVRALLSCHCESVDSGILNSTVETLDRHYAVNLRSNLLLVQAFAAQFAEPVGPGFTEGRIVAITSDALVGNVPYGTTKGALDRLILAAAVELAHLGITANVVNPGPTDNGWMNDDVRREVLANNLQPTLGVSADVARLVRFLCSDDGRWINRQILYSDGGLHRSSGSLNI